jgi:hypothetical protein
VFLRGTNRIFINPLDEFQTSKHEPILSKAAFEKCIIFIIILWGGTKSLGTAATFCLLYKPQMIDEGDCGAIGGMKIGRGNRSTQRKPAPAPLCPPQDPT